MANPNMIGGGRMSRMERSGDRRQLPKKKVPMGKLLLRLWKYIGKNRVLVILALVFSLSGSMLGLYGPKLSGKAINAIDLGTGNVDFETVFRCAGLMILFYFSSSALHSSGRHAEALPDSLPADATGCIQQAYPTACGIL